jgi:hypothetical protein
MQSAVMLSLVEHSGLCFYRCDVCRYAECHYCEHCDAECRNAECSYPESSVPCYLVIALPKEPRQVLTSPAILATIFAGVNERHDI